jgi:hypothetical protein
VQFYSGGWFADETYGVGLSTAPRPDGPWRKDPANPLLRSGGRIRGPGHNCTVTGPDEVSTYLVYHGHERHRPPRSVCVDRLGWAGNRFVLGGRSAAPSSPTEGRQEAPPPAVYDPAVRYWRMLLWVSPGPSGRLAVGDRRVALPYDHPVEVTLTRGEDGVVVRTPGGAELLPGVGAGEVSAEAGAEILSRALSTLREDAPARRLADGGRGAWDWGRRGPTEVSLTVTGAVTVRLGSMEQPVPAADGPRHVRVFTETGGAVLTVTAHDEATVGDMEMVARPERPVGTAPIVAALWTGLRRVVFRWTRGAASRTGTFPTRPGS